MTQSDPKPAPAEGPPPVAKLAALYTLGRFAVFAVLLALLWVVGLRSFPLIIFALALSMPAAYFLLAPLREQLAERLLRRREYRASVRAELTGD